MTIFAGRRAEFLFECVDEISYAFNARSVATFFERTGRRHKKVCGIVETKRQDVFCKRFAEFRFEFPREINFVISEFRADNVYRVGLDVIFIYRIHGLSFKTRNIVAVARFHVNITQNFDEKNFFILFFLVIRVNVGQKSVYHFFEVRYIHILEPETYYFFVEYVSEKIRFDKLACRMH